MPGVEYHRTGSQEQHRILANSKGHEETENIIYPHRHNDCVYHLLAGGYLLRRMIKTTCADDLSS